MSRASAYAVSLGTAVLLMLFVIMPLGAVLIESVRLRGPLTPREMRTAVLAALERLEPEPRRTLLARWGDEVTPAQRMEATAATLEAMNLRVLWDRKAPFDQQIAAAEAAVTGLTENQRAAFTAEFPVQVAVLHKRIALAFRVRDRLSPAEFDTLRSGTRSGFGLTHYREFLGDPRLRRAGLHSLFVATTASLISMVLAYALAFAVNRRGTRVPSLVRFTVLTPLVSPPIIMALAGILLFGRQGLITRGLLQERLGLIDADVTNLYGVSGVIVAMVLSFLPHAFIILDDVLARHDGRVEEAAASQGATAWQIFWRVTLPLTRPGVIRAALVVFILSMTDFGNPLVIGRGYSVLAGVVYDEIIGYQNSSLAAALCVWLILPTLTAYFLFERSERRKRFATGAATGGPPELPPGDGRGGRMRHHRPVLRRHRAGFFHARLGGGLHADPGALPVAGGRGLQRRRGGPATSAHLEQRQDRRDGRAGGGHLQRHDRLPGRAGSPDRTECPGLHRPAARGRARGHLRRRVPGCLQQPAGHQGAGPHRHGGHPGAQHPVRQHLRGRPGRAGDPPAAGPRSGRGGRDPRRHAGPEVLPGHRADDPACPGPGDPLHLRARPGDPLGRHLSGQPRPQPGLRGHLPQRRHRPLRARRVDECRHPRHRDGGDGADLAGRAARAGLG
ncbi:MAG: ABC transporter permease subunit [candidate division NC10 bacterium]|nr:ABC transporter permease subunit [candidate division NC10 bacterium]